MNLRDRLCVMNCHCRFYELEDFFQSVRKLGMHYVELWNGPIYYYTDARRHDSPEQLKKLCDRHQITIVGVCPGQTNPKLNNIAIKQKHRQEKVLNYRRRMIDIACVLGCRQVLITSGRCYCSEAVEETWNHSVVMMEGIADYAKRRNAILALEAPQPGESRFADTIQDIRRYRNEVRGSRLKACIDFGTVARMGHTPQEYSEASGGDITHIHFMNRSPAGYLVWGDGSRDLKTDLAAFEEYGYQGYPPLGTMTQRYYEKPWSVEMKALKSFEE